MWRKYWYATNAALAVNEADFDEVEGQRTIMGDLEGVVERFCDIGKIGYEGELGDDVRQIHDYDPLQRRLRNFGSRKNARL